MTWSSQRVTGLRVEPVEPPDQANIMTNEKITIFEELNKEKYIKHFRFKKKEKQYKSYKIGFDIKVVFTNFILHYGLVLYIILNLIKIKFNSSNYKTTWPAHQFMSPKPKKIYTQ